VKNGTEQAAAGGSAASTVNTFGEELKIENSSLSKNVKQNRDYGKVEANKKPKNNKFDRLMEQYEHKIANSIEKINRKMYKQQILKSLPTSQVHQMNFSVYKHHQTQQQFPKLQLTSDERHDKTRNSQLTMNEESKSS